MPIPLLFVNPSALTLLTAAPLSSRSPQRRQSPSYQISTTICMNTKPTRTKPDSDSAQFSPPKSFSDSDQPDDPAADPLLIDPDNDEVAPWAEDSDEDSIEEDEKLDGLLLNGDDETATKLPDNEDLLMAAGFDDDDAIDDDDDDDDPADEDEDEQTDDEDDEDDELAARANGDDFDHDISISTLDKSDRGLSPRRMTLDPDDEDENVDDVEDMIEPISEGLEPIFEDEETAIDLTDATEAETEELPTDEEEEEIPETFDEETEEEIQNAAQILSNSGLLGLGVEGGKRADVSAVKEFAMGKKSSASELEEEFDDEGLPLTLGEEEEEPEEEDDEEKDFIDDYPDLEDEDEDGFTLTSQSSFGRVWELNEDSYVTITEPGQSYAYELDEEDEEDQEMASVRRGKQGGWSGGLASYPADSLPKGSREWIARRSYELMTKATPVEMFRWTRWHAEPPASIIELYPEAPPAPTPLGKTTLKFSSPSADTPTIGKDTSGSAAPSESQKKEEVDIRQNPLERSIKFPCTYKFKVEGSGDNFPECLRETVQNVVGKELPNLELEVEPAGRYERVVIPVEVENAQQVTVLYDALRSNPSVKFSFG